MNKLLLSATAAVAAAFLSLAPATASEPTLVYAAGPVPRMCRAAAMTARICASVR